MTRSIYCLLSEGVLTLLNCPATISACQSGSKDTPRTVRHRAQTNCRHGQVRPDISSLARIASMSMVTTVSHLGHFPRHGFLRDRRTCQHAVTPLPCLSGIAPNNRRGLLRICFKDAGDRYPVFRMSLRRFAKSTMRCLPKSFFSHPAAACSKKSLSRPGSARILRARSKKSLSRPGSANSIEAESGPIAPWPDRLL